LLIKIWRLCGHVKVTFWLLLLICFSLAAGSFYVKFYPQIFRPLNDFLLQDWFRRYGENYPDKIWWLWMLLVLLFVLGINTGVCAIDRILNLWSKRKQMNVNIFFLKNTPSLTHICFLVMLSGHLLSSITGFNKAIPIIPDMKATLPIQADIEVLKQQCYYYDAPELLKGFTKQCAVSVKLQAAGETTVKQVSFLHPFFWQGFSFHLGMDKKSMNHPEIRLIMKRDPGVRLILPGFTVLVLLMLWYFPQLNKGTKGG